jgi:hypothetical protein
LNTFALRFLAASGGTPKRKEGHQQI